MPQQLVAALLVGLMCAGACTKPNEATGPGSRDQSDNSGQLEKLALRYQGAAGNVSYPELAEDLGYLAPIKLQWLGNVFSGPTSIQTVVTGDTDYGSAFNGAVLKLIAAKAPIRAVVGSYGVDEGTWGGFYVSSESPIRTARDLLGKKIAVNTVGAHQEFILREYLLRAGLSATEAKQVTLIAIPPLNADQALRHGQVDVSFLNGIFRDRALAQPGLRLLFSDLELYGPFTAGSYVMSNQFIRANPNTTRHFVTAVGRAIEWARGQKPEAVQARMAAIIERRKRPAEDTSVVKYWRSTGMAQPGGRLAEREFQVWIDWLVKDGGLKPGQLALNELFTNEFNATEPAAASGG
jgi:ABC-type nitrate/sulfonate/bicarbonate transport system substrate-binding protein